MRWTVLWILLVGLVLTPFLLFERQFDALAAWLAAGHLSGWLTAAAIWGLLTFDVFLPVPSSIVSTAAGAMLGFWKGAATVWLGMTAGCLIGYATGWWAAGAARRLVGEEGLTRAGNVMDRYGPWALVVCRPVPVLAEASTVFAGIVRTRFLPFVSLTSLSNLGIAVAYAAVGAYTMRIESFLLTVIAALAIPRISMAAAKLWLRK
jgi:uncharacterized membrane protein YdjX (TVP38/TMEM64 family)